MRKRTARLTTVFMLAATLSGITRMHAAGSRKTVRSNDSIVSVRTGIASFYAGRFQGKHTSSGEVLDNNAYTCAHPYLPYGTYVRVTNIRNNKSVVVRVTDRFRPSGNHLIDITRCAARDIDIIAHGRAQVRLEVLRASYAQTLTPADSISVPIPENRFPLMLPVPQTKELPACSSF